MWSIKKYQPQPTSSPCSHQGGGDVKWARLCAGRTSMKTGVETEVLRRSGTEPTSLPFSGPFALNTLDNLFFLPPHGASLRTAPAVCRRVVRSGGGCVGGLRRPALTRGAHPGLGCRMPLWTWGSRPHGGLRTHSMEEEPPNTFLAPEQVCDGQISRAGPQRDT